MMSYNNIEFEDEVDFMAWHDALRSALGYPRFPVNALTGGQTDLAIVDAAERYDSKTTGNILAVAFDIPEHLLPGGATDHGGVYYDMKNAIADGYIDEPSEGED